MLEKGREPLKVTYSLFTLSSSSVIKKLIQMTRKARVASHERDQAVEKIRKREAKLTEKREKQLKVTSKEDKQQEFS